MSHILIPGKRVLEPRQEIIMPSCTLENEYIVETAKVDQHGREIPGTRRVRARFPNLITNIGMDRIGTNTGWAANCYVGTGSNTPQFTDTNLQNRVATNNSVQSTTSIAQPTAPYYITLQKVFRFNAGFAGGAVNITEVGVGWSTSSGLYSRALTLDGLGSPAAIPVQADEILDVTFLGRVYVPTADVVGTINITGVGSRDFTLRAANATQTNISFKVPNNWSLGSIGFQGGVSDESGNPGWTVYTGALGAVTAVPSGSALVSSTGAGQNLGTYGAGNHYREFRMTAGTGNFNNSGLLSFQFGTAFGAYQMQLSATIAKTNQQVLTMDFRHTWARH